MGGNGRLVDGVEDLNARGGWCDAGFLYAGKDLQGVRVGGYLLNRRGIVTFSKKGLDREREGGYIPNSPFKDNQGLL
jgi:hypothetical protein